MCPIIRETDGLAMSSRNIRLTSSQRKRAAEIHQTLFGAKKLISQKTPLEIITFAMNKLNIPEFNPEYFEIVDGTTLLPISSFDQTDFAVACTAVWVGEVRLIDNVILKP